MRRAPYIRLLAAFLGLVLTAAPTAPAFAFSRVKDLVEVEGIRDNMLVGYGLVVGLNGSGDSLKNAPFTQLSLQTMLERMGVNTRGTTMQTKNVAAVMVTANLPAFAASGTRIDISVSALPSRCRAARFWSPRCSARTGRSMRSARGRWRSAASRPAATRPA
jgi:flagellar P-ring protein precursor FlgI